MKSKSISIFIDGIDFNDDNMLPFNEKLYGLVFKLSFLMWI